MIADNLRGMTDWSDVANAIAIAGGVRHGDDDYYQFPDGSSVLVPCLTFVVGKHSHRQERFTPKIICNPLPHEPGDIQEAINRLAFRFARSMPKIPHQYTCRPEADEDRSYVTLFHAVMRSPVIAAWQGINGTARNEKPLRYLHYNGWWYWSMSSRRTVKPIEEGQHPIWLSHHINRCTDDAFKKTNMVILEGIT